MLEGRLVMTDLLMELETPFSIKAIEPSERKPVVREMIDLVTTLHRRCGIVHGDIKLGNMLGCREGNLRLCGYNTARSIDEEPE